VQLNRIDAETFSKMFLAGAKRLESKKEIINELNVFPVPDGDTGTNMNLTIQSAVNEVNNITDMNMQVLSKSISSGSLRGARGNSGVILSQLLRGFTKVIRDEEEVDIETFAKAMEKGVETAYKAVMKPKEGTILTVARGAAEHALEICGQVTDYDEFFKSVINHAEDVLQKTPDMLPVLKEAGVVDSGGQGLLEILKGGYALYSGEDVDLLFNSSVENEAEKEAEEKIVGYATAFVINRTNEKSLESLGAFYETIARNVIITELDSVIKITAFTEDPGRLLTKALAYGNIDDIKISPCTKEPSPEAVKDETVIDNSANEAEADNSADVIKSQDETITEIKAEPVAKKEPSKEMGFVAVSVGEGMNEIFKGLGVDSIITGGQTMNPSTDDVLNAINEVDAKTVFVLPNNKNIILAANQAQYLVEDKKVIVIPTKTIPQGITALISFMSDSSPEENEKLMNEEIVKVKTGQVTFAVRDTVINGMEIHQGNIMGIGDHDIHAVGTVVEDTTVEMLKHMVDEDSELICIYYGDEVDEEIANDLASTIEEEYPDCDVEIHFGGQPIYYYIVSVE